MKIIRNTQPISDLFNLMKTAELTINRTYQRGTGLWPDNARSYFIDTILNGFPFPKIILKQTVDILTKKSKREIIDGQQRMTTIRDFIDNKLKLTSVSKKYQGMMYKDLPEDVSEGLLAYEVSTDNIISATDEEILEIFKRINSYTLPLNNSEKRHATYQGKFKWFINDILEHVTPFFEQYHVLSLRDISRMDDADLLTECCQLRLEGIQNRSTNKLELIYKSNNESFNNEEALREIITSTFNFIKNNLTEVFDNCKVQAYNFYTLMGALMYNKYGLPDKKGDLSDYPVINNFAADINQSTSNLIRALSEAEDKKEDGEYPEFVKACIATTHSYNNRLIRIRTFISILQS